MRFLPLAALVLAASPACAAEGWKMQFFHDQAGSSLTLTDLCFASPAHGFASGFLSERKKTRPILLRTADGGESWHFQKAGDIGTSLFFLNDVRGWLVTMKGMYQTADGGNTWKKMAGGPKDALRVYFRDERHGWLVGFNKSMLVTGDGGATWTPVPAAAEIKSSPENTSFSWIAFAGEKNGVVAGSSIPQRRGRQIFPDWMEPEYAEKRREWPALSILLETRDGGASWSASTTSIFGRITRVRLTPDGRGLGLIEFFNAFDWPAEVFRIDWRAGKSERVFRARDRVVTDVALPEDGPAYLAGYEPPGQLARSPVPGRLHILRSQDLAAWQEMEIDYRAVARRAMISAWDRDHIWVATDTGMILRLTR